MMKLADKGLKSEELMEGRVETWISNMGQTHDYVKGT